MRTNPPQTTSGFEPNLRRDRAFTLIELLVVLAALAILAALMASALARSGDTSARTVCINNLRQMGTALNLYAAENQDYLAWPNWGNDGPPCPPGWLYYGDSSGSPVTTAHGGPAAISAFGSRQVTHLKQGVFWKYILSGNAFICPNDLKPSLAGLWAMRAETLSTYTMNGAACYYPSPNSQYSYATPKLSQAWSPSCYILGEPDQNLNSGCYNDGANYPGTDGEIGSLHGPGTNILSLSGDARFITKAEYGTQLDLPENNLLYWSPKSNRARQ